MAPTYIIAFVALVVPVLARHGVVVDTADLTTTLVTLTTVAAPLLVMFRQWYTGRSTVLGTRPQ